MSDLSTYQIVHAEFITLSMVIGLAVSLALSAALTGVQMLLTPKAKPVSLPKLEQRGQTQTVRQPIGYWRYVYGETRVGLHPVYIATTENKSYLHIVGVAACHEVSRIGTIVVKDRPVYSQDIGADGVVTGGPLMNSGHNVPFLRVKTKLGTDDQTAFSDLSAESPEWTADHRCRGHALLYTRHKFSSEIYASGVPNISAVIQGKKVYDPRDATTAWKPNPALCIRDYLLTSELLGGGGAINDEFTDSHWTAAANVCDEFVATPTTGAAALVHQIQAVSASGDTIDLDGERLKFQTGDRVTLTRGGTITRYVVVEQEQKDDGDQSKDVRYPRIQLATTYANALTRTIEDLDGTETGPVTKTGEPRYTLNGTFTTDAAPRKVLEEMLSCCGGRLIYSGGKFRLMGLAWEAPTLTLDEDDLRGTLKVQTKRARRDRFNAIKGTFVSPLNDWQPSDYPAVTNATYETQDGNVRLFAELPQPYTTRSGQAQRVAKLMLVRNRFERVAQYPSSLAAYDCKAGEIVAITNSRWSWSSKHFEIINRKPVIREGDDGKPVLGVDLVLNEADASAFTWASTEEQSDPPIIKPTLPNWSTETTPTSLVARTNSTLTAAGDLIYQPVFSWSLSDAAAVSARGQFEVQLRRTLGRGFTFDGTDDYIAIGSNVDFSAGGAFSLEAYAFWDGTTGADRSLWHNGQAWLYRRDSDGRLVGAIAIQGGGTLEVPSLAALAANTWVRASLTWDGASLALYLGGVLQAIVGGTRITEGGDRRITEGGDVRIAEGAAPVSSTTAAATIGRGLAGTSATAYWKGKIDDVSVWRGTARTAADILATINHAEGPALSGRETYLLHYWPMDERNTATVFDATPQGNNGTVTGGATQVDGAIQQAWQPSWFVDGAQRSTPLPSLDFNIQHDLRVRTVNALFGKSSWAQLTGFAVGGSAGATSILDYGSVADAATVTDDLGSVADAVTATEDYGTVI